MKTIGLIGGITWESTTLYYKIINQKIQENLGGISSAKIILYSFDFNEISKLQQNNEWIKLNMITLEIAQKLKNAGADFILICSNTMHKTFDYISKCINIPIIHIADSLGQQIIKDEIKKVGLFGTTFVMEQGFIKHKLVEKYNLDIIIPNLNQRQIINNIIFKELAKGIFNKESKKIYIEIMNEMVLKYGCEAIVLGCTEIPLLINKNDTKIKLYDTTTLHALDAVNYSLLKK